MAMPSLLSAEGFLGLALVAFAVHRVLKVGRREQGLPPGPPTIPILGNLHVFPRSYAYRQFTDWARTYGGIISVNLEPFMTSLVNNLLTCYLKLKIGAETIIVVSDARIARELIDQKNANTSDRPTNYLATLVTGGNHVALARYSPFWRRSRKVIQSFMTKEACEQHKPIQVAEATQLITSGARFTIAGRSSTILKYVPERWASWKRICKEIRQKQVKLYGSLVESCERRLAQNVRNGCAMETILDVKEKNEFDHDLVRGICGTMIEGGTDTTFIFLQSLTLMLVAHPDIQAKAHKEIDSVIGSERCPTLEDFQSLPLSVSDPCFLWDCLTPRWRMSRRKFEVDGFFIPKGSTIFSNQWGMFHDPEFYDDPEVFRPHRFLTSEYGQKPGADITGRRHDLHFGGGRRICPGTHLANTSMILTTMNMLWAFEFKEAVDPMTSAPIPVDINNYSKAIVAIPNPFRCDIVVRSESHAALIRQAFVASRPVFEQFEHELSDEDKAFVRNQQA
ncbi:hypothetical protein EW146_g4447 [Bondarzewia mesenterica]|uniref:Cytochrome P450 n=1 Tax=Bondarzewia mesenterica TaxID=1095465 RepID=A0A4S4M0B9_9AGAM|nr:hypothetical protein EW146_g4447 [Bondarzewia mesenterica]